jgi:hypothetical protein
MRGRNAAPRLARLWPLPAVVLLVIAIPILVYRLVRPHVGSDTAALAIAGIVPAASVVVRAVVRRRIDPIGTIGLAAFAAALLVSVLTGGSSLPLKLRDSVVTGALGLACVASIAARRPLVGVALRLLGRDPGDRPMHAVTAIAGGTLFVHSAAHAVVALTLPTATYVVAARLVGIPVYAAGFGLVLLYGRLRGSATHGTAGAAP